MPLEQLSMTRLSGQALGVTVDVLWVPPAVAVGVQSATQPPFVGDVVSQMFRMHGALSAWMFDGLAAKGDIWWLMCSDVNAAPSVLWAAAAPQRHKWEGERGERRPGRDRGKRGWLLGRGGGWGSGFEERVCMWGGVHVHHASRLTLKGCVLGGWVCHGKINDFLSNFRGGETRRASPWLPAAAPCPLLHKETTQINQGWSALCFPQPSSFQPPCQWPLRCNIHWNTDCVHV